MIKPKLLLILLLFSVLSLVPSECFAQDQSTDKKDSDFDGITDDSEVKNYKTDPNKEDTDGDGVLDAQEIIEGTNPLDPASSSVENKAPNNVLISANMPLAWYIGRISGIAAFIMFSLVVIEGLLMTTKLHLKFRKVIPPPDVLEMHAFNATFIAFGFLVLHFTSLMFDDFIKLKPLEILVPFTLQREITSAMGFNLMIPVSLGVIAFYLSLILIITSRYRGKIISTKKWRLIHYSSFLFYILFIIHGFTSGSDSNELWMRLIYITSLTSVIVLILIRIFYTKRLLKVSKPLTDSQISTTSQDIKQPSVS